MIQGASARRVPLQLGYWSALLSVVMFLVFTGCFIAIAVLNPLFLWTNLAEYVAYVQTHGSFLGDLARLAMLLFGLLYVVLLNSLYELVPDENKIWVRISLCFGIGFAVLTGAHYFVQISAVRLNILHDNLTGLEQVVQANPYSALAAMNMFGWTLMFGASSLFIAPIFAGGRLQRTIRWAFIANGIFCLLGGIGYVLEIVVLVFFTINLGMGGAVMVAMTALTLLFQHMEREPRDVMNEAIVHP